MIFRRKSGDDGACRLAYQRQDSGQTLAEGLEEYYRANPRRVTRPEDLPAASAALFRSHDLCHVIFGLDTAPADEVLADTRTILACDVGPRRYLEYLAGDPQARALFKEFGYLRSVWQSLLAAPRVLRAIGEMRRLKKRWPWRPPDSFQDWILSELRAEFGIRVV